MACNRSSILQDGPIFPQIWGTPRRPAKARGAGSSRRRLLVLAASPVPASPAPLPPRPRVFASPDFSSSPLLRRLLAVHIVAPFPAGPLLFRSSAEHHPAVFAPLDAAASPRLSIDAACNFRIDDVRLGLVLLVLCSLPVGILAHDPTSRRHALLGCYPCVAPAPGSNAAPTTAASLESTDRPNPLQRWMIPLSISTMQYRVWVVEFLNLPSVVLLPRWRKQGTSRPTSQHMKTT